ncbi:unnamed protein product, partial [Meganyctiphanes norvegica]
MSITLECVAPGKMAALSSRTVARLSQNLHRISLTRGPKVNHVYAALLHNSYTLNAEGLPLKMPSLSPTMTEGTIVQWLKKEGDTIAPGDMLCDIQTDKAVVGLDTEEDGILAKILVPEGSKDVTVGTLIAVLAPEGEDWKTIEIPKVETEAPIAAAPPPLPTAPAPSIAAVAATPAVIHTVKHGNFGISVLLLLEQYGLTPEQVTATGRNGILLKGDVLKHIKTLGLQPLPVPIVPPPTVDKPAAAAAVVAPAAPAPPSAPVAPPLTGVSEDGWVDIEVTNMRRTIAKRLSQSKVGIAHSYGTLDCCADKLLALRKYHKAEGISISVNDLIIKAVATALQHCPEMNAVWKGDQLHIASEVDISVAVATPAGLITPIVKDADALGVEEINATVKELASRARINKLKPEEFLGGTFTISNLGMFGISEFSAIINPPQCGILAVGGSRLTLSESGSPTTRMSATLSYDRAAVDDYTAAIFLETLKDLLEEPNTLLVGARSRDINHPLSALL